MLAWAWRTITLKNMKGDTETPAPNKVDSDIVAFKKTFSSADVDSDMVVIMDDGCIFPAVRRRIMRKKWKAEEMGAEEDAFVGVEEDNFEQHQEARSSSSYYVL
ncbi:uncharacterized protein HKW66_Vig0170220 [Vigna angularis]|uniref:Uncharacterized protein n=1 Tax=Phaseolus angularis TaxID=3914 RepID=A0A8T0JR62_PHAAN|nr:uncharacterized protein HKW66_Vig0170220 [Vigna angularis]